MSLRIWTAGIAVMGLALYTLSFLPISASDITPTFELEPKPAQADLPGATMVPLNFVDPRSQEFVPFDSGWESNHGCDSLAPLTPPAHSEPARTRPVANVVRTIHSRFNLEVLS